MTQANTTNWQPSDGVKLDNSSMEVVKRMSSVAVVAGPGAGKTELLAQRAAYLLQTDVCRAPKRILAISFKRDAAKNLKERVERRCGDTLAARFESYTFDAFAKNLLDRFASALPEWCRPSREYQIVFPRFSDWNQFLDQLRATSQFDVSGLNVPKIEKQHAYIGSAPTALPLAEPVPSTPLEWAVLTWWNKNIKKPRSMLTFGMISTLATTVLRHNPMILNVLRRTYAHVFLDEFQDTTLLQYSLLREAFIGSKVVVTAVGDTKQRIMTWAGAAPEGFDWLRRDFNAHAVALQSNFRSNRRIVEIVNAMAKSIEPAAVEVVSARPDDPLPNPVDAIISYPDSAAEANSLAEFIAKQVDGGEPKLQPEDFLLLVRQRADAVEGDLKPAFEQHGLTLRNEARAVGGMTIQDLVTEPLSDLFIGFLQMAVDDRDNSPFHRVRNRLMFVFGVDEDRTESFSRLDDVIRRSVGILRSAIKANTPAKANFDELISQVMECLGRTSLRRLSPEYEHESRMTAIQKAISEFLTECAESATDWLEVIVRFTGRRQVRLMTIHKSKGLEAHTVIFLRLQNSSFHSSADMSEERLAFFVAMSRARERIFITTTSEQRNRVTALFDLLQAAKFGSPPS